MFNLGLGEIEFNPIHTIEQHHPNGYRVPDITDLSDNDDMLSYNHTIPESTTKKPEINNSLSDNIDGSSLQNSTDGDFKSLHDPKHRHPRHHGKHTDFSWLTMQNIDVTFLIRTVCKVVCFYIWYTLVHSGRIILLFTQAITQLPLMLLSVF